MNHSQRKFQAALGQIVKAVLGHMKLLAARNKQDTVADLVFTKFVVHDLYVKRVCKYIKHTSIRLNENESERRIPTRRPQGQ